ncbi:TauD/TfdA family dioxygenase [Paraburkholderia sp.]|uniref:TauD/TfdA family dioxygenase n=1 Tax=Paraburkholderia sp. TaxID=1926495 RepID=UPI0039E2A82E
MKETSKTSMLQTPTPEASAWSRSELAADPSWIFQLTPAQAQEVRAAVSAVNAKNLRAGEFGKEDFPLPTLAAVMPEIVRQMEDGRGVVLIRGLPVNPVDDEDATKILWGIGTYLGRGLKQTERVNLLNIKDNLVGHIIDQGMDPNAVNADRNRSNADLEPHCDPSDYVALLCVRPALKGGVSHIVSSTRIYNELLEDQPEVLPALYSGFYHDLRGKGADGHEVTSRRIPVYTYYDGKLSCNHHPATVYTGAKKLGRELDPEEQAAMLAMREAAEREDLKYEMDMRTGDLQLLNNYTILHSRTDWVDAPEWERKRLMLRLWLHNPASRSLPEGFVGGYVTETKHDVAKQTRVL